MVYSKTEVLQQPQELQGQSDVKAVDRCNMQAKTDLTLAC